MLHKYDDVETPFGEIVSSFEFRSTPTDEPQQIKYLNPICSTMVAIADIS